MVRINLIEPKALADQHLIAEYNETLMLFGTVAKHPAIRNQPPSYCLGKGHITFFKDKLLYLKKRHELIKKEMKKRNFATAVSISLKGYPLHLHNDWKPSKKDASLIKECIAWKLRKKPAYYRYAGEHKPHSFFHSLIRGAKIP